MSPFERERLVAEWNSQDTDYQVCILNLLVSSAGLNLHGNCRRGIIASPFWNVNTPSQCTGRLIRIGQKPWQDMRMYTKVCLTSNHPIPPQ